MDREERRYRLNRKWSWGVAISVWPIVAFALIYHLNNPGNIYGQVALGAVVGMVGILALSLWWSFGTSWWVLFSGHPVDTRSASPYLLSKLLHRSQGVYYRYSRHLYVFRGELDALYVANTLRAWS